MLIKIKVFPNSKKNKIKKRAEDSYKVEMREEAKEGKANKALIDLLSQYFNLPKSKIRIIKGWKQRNKIIKIKDGKTK